VTEPADPDDSPLDEAPLDEAPEIDPTQIRMAIEELHSHQNLIGGAIAGFVASCIGAALWAVVTIATGLQIGWIAVGIGFLVGFAVRSVGKGLEPVFGYVGGTLSLVGCLAGNLFALIGLIAKSKGVPFLDELNAMNTAEVIDLMVATFGPMDLLFYSIAVYEGYRLSFRQLTERDADELMANQV
jgi:hypothetical protein